MKYTSILLLVILVFGNVVSASTSVCKVFDYQQGSEQVILDSDEVEKDTSDLFDCCDHYCKCMKQMGNCPSIMSINLSNVLLQSIRFDLNLSQSSPPLLRPPIA